MRDDAALSIEEHVEDALRLMPELGLQTLKALVVEADKSSVEPVVDRMIAAGLVASVKKHRYVWIGDLSEHG